MWLRKRFDGNGAGIGVLGTSRELPGENLMKTCLRESGVYFIFREEMRLPPLADEPVSHGVLSRHEEQERAISLQQSS